MERQYFLTIVDDYTRVKWTLLLTNKSEVYHKFKNFVIEHLNQFSTPIKNIRSNNGSEFTSKKFQDFLHQLGIHH